MKLKVKITLAIIILGLVLGCAFGLMFLQHRKDSIMLATTTSLQDTGLLSDILPDFEKKYGIEVSVVAVGTGQALEYGKRGDAHILLVHAPTQEIEFMKNGYGVERRTLFWNTFVLIGPETNPAKINASDNISLAFMKIYNSSSFFVSRGDMSGTHLKELAIWKECGVSSAALTNKTWYINASAGMGTTLLVADEKFAYTLSDIATYLKFKPKLKKLINIEITITENIKNLYSLIITKAGYDNKNREVNCFRDWLISNETLSKIENYTINSQKVFNLLR
ncbi:MAG: substrate-binding domain-containing protein [Thermoplasmata archaeon]